jgi:hypothetical protein
MNRDPSSLQMWCRCGRLRTSLWSKGNETGVEPIAYTVLKQEHRDLVERTKDVRTDLTAQVDTLRQQLETLTMVTEELRSCSCISRSN